MTDQTLTADDLRTMQVERANENKELHDVIERLNADIAVLRANYGNLNAAFARLKADNDALAAERRRLKDRVAELENAVEDGVDRLQSALYGVDEETRAP